MASKQINKTNDERFLNALRTANSSIIQEIYRNYFSRIREMILRNQGNNDDANDIFQEALMVLYRKVISRSDFTISSSFYTYLYGISRNLWLKELEKKRKTRVTKLEYKEHRYEEDPEGIIWDEWDEEARKSARERLYREKFRNLGDDCRKVLDLFLNGTRLKEIAKIMGYGSEMYAKKRKYKCQKKLMEMIRNDAKYKRLSDQ